MVVLVFSGVLALESFPPILCSQGPPAIGLQATQGFNSPGNIDFGNGHLADDWSYKLAFLATWFSTNYIFLKTIFIGWFSIRFSWELLILWGSPLTRFVVGKSQDFLWRHSAIGLLHFSLFITTQPEWSSLIQNVRHMFHQPYFQTWLVNFSCYRPLPPPVFWQFSTQNLIP